MSNQQRAIAYLTADVVLLAHDGEALHVLLIERRCDPYEGCWALPGGHLNDGENFIDAAARELWEETGISLAPTLPRYGSAPLLVDVGIYGAPDRDPRGRYVTVAYVALLDVMPTPHAGDDAATAQWLPVSQVLEFPERLAFDHAEILVDAVRTRWGGPC